MSEPLTDAVSLSPSLRVRVLILVLFIVYGSDISKDVSGLIHEEVLQHLLFQIVETDRDSGTKIEHEKARSEASRLYQDSSRPYELNQRLLAEILMARSTYQVMAILQCYQKVLKI